MGVLPLPSSFRRATVVGAAALGPAVVMVDPAPALAQSTDRVLADALFREGRALMEQEKIREACAKFAESYRLDRALGTLINLALCHEKEGRTATAWAEFNEAAAEAAAEKDDREPFARKHVAALAAELPRLALAVAPEASALLSLEIRLDGAALGRAAWSSPLPIDPGEHEIRATAEGKRPWSANVIIPKGAGVTSLSVPALEDLPKPDRPPSPPPASPAEPRSGSAQRTLGWVAGGGGVAGLAVGTVFGLHALSLKSERDAHCSSGNLCDQEGVDKDGEARSAATISTIGFVAGGVLAATGVVLILTAPKDSTRVGVSGRGLFVGGDVLKRKVAVAMLAPVVAAFFVWGGCALVIDLGDEARLKLPDASIIEDAGPDDAPADDGSTKFTCGLPPSPNGACNDCIKTNCCEVSTKCADDPDCVARLECIKDCMAQYLCILTCKGDNPNIEALTTCSASNCGVCSPGPECTQLGKCAFTFDADGGERILREVARGVVLEVNEEKCKAHRANLAKHKAAEPACTQPLE